MSNLDRLNGVAHDIGHHAQSGLSWLYPHLGEACRDAGVLVAAVDLVHDAPYPEDLPERRPLALALCAMRGKLASILERHGFALEDLVEARLEFTFPPGYGDYCSYQVRSTLVSRDRAFECVIPMIGSA
jgi:hypothetical protein